MSVDLCENFSLLMDFLTQYARLLKFARDGMSAAKVIPFQKIEENVIISVSFDGYQSSVISLLVLVLMQHKFYIFYLVSLLGYLIINYSTGRVWLDTKLLLDCPGCM